MVFVTENGLRSDLRVCKFKNFHGGSMPQVPKQMHVMHTLSVPMLCQCNLLILATPLSTKSIAHLQGRIQVAYKQLLHLVHPNPGHRLFPIYC